VVLSDTPALGSPGFTPLLGDNFRVVSAEGGIIGRFSILTQPGGLASGTRLAAFYDVFSSQSIDLKVVPTSYATYLSDSNGNSRSSAAALDQLLDRDQRGSANTAQTQLLYLTADKTAPELPGFVQSLSGEIHGALAATAPQASQWLESAVQRRSAARQPTVQTIANSADEAAAADALWLEVGWNHGRRNSDSTASGFSSDRSQLALGFDLPANASTLFGVGLSHAETRVSAGSGSGSLSETIGFVYAQQRFSEWLFHGMASYGSGTTDATRPDPTAMVSRLESELSTSNTLLKLRLQRPVALPGQRVEPFASVTWQKTRRGAFDEGDAVAALAASGDSLTGLRTVIGVTGHSQQQDHLSAARSYRFSLGLGHDAGDLLRPRLDARLADLHSTIAAPTVGRGFVQATAFGTVRLHPRAYGHLGLNSELRQGLSDVGITIGAVLVL
jgi:fibronectin-binding autotransporter adhesin